MARSWMGRPRRQSPLPSPTTDFFSALFRLAFIFAFLGALWFLGFTWMQSWVVQVIVVLATCFTTVVLALFARDQDVRWQRVPSLLIDLALISAALFTASFQAPASLFQMYYLVILEAAIWFQLRGALLAATAASVAYGVVQLSLAQSYVDLEALSMQAAGVVPFLLIVALVAGYMEASQQQARRLREQMRLARTLQDLMLPPSPPQPLGWQVALRLEPAGEVGGDLYLVESLGPGAGRHLRQVGLRPDLLVADPVAHPGLRPRGADAAADRRAG